MSDTLVLDPSYRPVGLISWQRAITLLFENKVEVIEHHDDWTVRSVTVTLRVPSIVRFIRAIRRRKQVVKFSRENVWGRDKGACQYCSAKVARSDFTYDHVIPRAQGGQTTWNNVVVCCTPCNQKKGGRTPAQAGMMLRSTPARPTKLPDGIRFTITYRKGMPESWAGFLRDVAYWNTALDEE